MFLARGSSHKVIPRDIFRPSDYQGSGLLGEVSLRLRATPSEQFEGFPSCNPAQAACENDVVSTEWMVRVRLLPRLWKLIDSCRTGVLAPSRRGSGARGRDFASAWEQVRDAGPLGDGQRPELFRLLPGIRARIVEVLKRDVQRRYHGGSLCGQSDGTATECHARCSRGLRGQYSASR